MTFLTKYSRCCALGLFLVAPLALSGQPVGDTTDQQSAPQAREGATGGTSGTAGTTPRQTRPSGTDDYQTDSTIHRTGQEERTRSDGQPFETGQDDSDNVTYPGD